MLSTLIVTLALAAPPVTDIGDCEWIQFVTDTREIVALKQGASDAGCLVRPVTETLDDGTVILTDIRCTRTIPGCKRECERASKIDGPTTTVWCVCP